MQIGVHARLEHRDAAKLVEFRGMGIIVEGAGDEHIEASIAGLPSRSDQVGAGYGAKLWADEDRGSLLCSCILVAFDVTPFGADQFPRPGRD